MDELRAELSAPRGGGRRLDGRRPARRTFGRAAWRRLPLALAAPVLAACGGRDGEAHAAPPAGGAIAAATPDPAGRDARDAELDSALAAFRAPLAPVAALEGGERSRDAIVARFVRALERADTNDLRAMMMSRAEFAYLVYPGSAHTRRPSRQEAPLVWFLHLQDSGKGLSRALARRGGRPLGVVGYGCAPQPVREGRNLLWHDCRLRLASGGDTSEVRLFGAVLERDGRFKLHSFANDL